MRCDWYKVSSLDGKKEPKLDYRNSFPIPRWRSLNCVLCIDDIAIILRRTWLFTFLFHKGFSLDRVCQAVTQGAGQLVCSYTQPGLTH